MHLNRRSAPNLGIVATLLLVTTTGCGAGSESDPSHTTSVIGTEVSASGDDVSASGVAVNEGGGVAPAVDTVPGSAPRSGPWSVAEIDDEAFAADPLGGIEISAAFDAALAPYQVELIELAASAAETIPHDKPRATASEEVALAALRMDAPSLALAYTRRVENWRRGSLIADLAMYFTEQGEMELAERLADRAFRIARGTEAEDPQSWRRARIATKAGHVYILCGRSDEAAQLLQGVQSPDMGIVDNARVKTMSDDEFDAYLTNVELATQAGDLELIVHTFGSCVELIERFWMDGTRRERLESVMRGYWTKMPIPERLALQMRLADVAMDKEDSAKALAYLDEAQEVVDGSRWLTRHLLPVQAELAVMRFNAGAKSSGRGQLREALATYDGEWAEMVDIWRAGALRPVAEGFLEIGDREKAALLYTRVVADGNTNPNVKPRAEDFAATCCSMALHGFEPDQELWQRMRDVRASLVQPR